jgi:hypothetical protein
MSGNLKLNTTSGGSIALTPENTASTITITVPAVNSTLNTSGAVNTVPAGSVSAPAITTTGDTNTGIFFPAADTIAFTEGGVESMRIDSSGNVGIGVTPAYRLSSKQSGNTGAASLGVVSINSANDTFIGIGYDSASDTNRVLASYISTGAFKPISFWTSDLQRMQIDTSGNVGIGTSSPATYGKLAIGLSASAGTNNVFGVYQSSGVDGAALRFAGYNYANNVQTAIDFVQNSASNFQSNIVFNTNSGSGMLEKARITYDGNLLVGTTVTSNTDGVMLGKGGAVGGGIVQLYKTGSGITNGLLNYYQTTYVGGINFDNTSTSFPTSSDIRLKKDIVDAPSATQKIDDIRIVSHGWKHDDAVVDFGIIAQELYKIIPCAVSKGDDAEKIKTVWGVDYSKLVPLLIKAHQEQQAIINQLQADVATLKGAA